MINKENIALLVAVASLISSVVAFIFPDNEHKRIRKVIGIMLLTVACVSLLFAEFGLPTEIGPLSKSVACNIAQETFPQSLEAVRNHFNLPSQENRFRLIYEGCDAVATGFIFEGETEFELAVPSNGCIDSYSGAYFSVSPVDESSGGLRAYSGVVRATGMTYRVVGCGMKP